MILKPVTSRWLGGVRRLTLLLIAVPVVAGLAYTWWSAWRGDVVAAVAGAAVTLAILGWAVLSMAWLRVGIALLRSGRRIERLERRLKTAGNLHHRHQERLAALAGDLQQHREQTERHAGQLCGLIDQSEERDRRAGQRAAAMQARIETFCELHDAQAEGLERRVAKVERSVRRAVEPADAVRISDAHWAVEDTPPGERTVAAFHHLVGQDDGTDGDGAGDTAGPSPALQRQGLNQEFASLIHQRDYAGALAKGDEIANRFPDSTAAADFRRVRPHLVRKIQLVESAPHSPGG